MSDNEEQALLQDFQNTEQQPKVLHFNWLLQDTNGLGITNTRLRTRRFLTSKSGHYAVLALVSADVFCIIIDFLINLFICERRCGQQQADYQKLLATHNALGIISLVFSSLFMIELMASIWAFGIRFFSSWFQCLDALVIIAGFIVDVCLTGILEELGSTVVVLRLWRVFKIMEELSTGAQEQSDALSERIERLENENQELRRRFTNSTKVVASHSGLCKENTANGLCIELYRQLFETLLAPIGCAQSIQSEI